MMAEDATLQIVGRIEQLDSEIAELRTAVDTDRTAEADRLEAIEAECAELRRLLAQAVRERNDALAAMGKQINGVGSDPKRTVKPAAQPANKEPPVQEKTVDPTKVKSEPAAPPARRRSRWI